MGVIGEAFVSVRPDSKGFEGETKSGIMGSLGGIAAAVGGAFAVDKVVEFGKKAVEAFEEAQQSELKLNDALARNPATTGQTAAAFDKLNTAIQDHTRYNKEASQSVEGQLSLFHLTADQIKTLTPLVEDYAARTGQDVTTAAKLAGAALLGKGRALKDVGINFKDLKDPTKNYTELVAGLSSQVKGFADKDGATFSGRMAILKNQFHDVMVEVGSKLAPVLTALMGFIATTAMPAFLRLADAIGKYLAPIVRDIVGDIRAFILGFTGTAGAITPAQAKIVDFGNKVHELYEKYMVPLIQFLEQHAKPILIALGVTLALTVAPFLSVAAAAIYAYTHFKIVRDVVADLVQFFQTVVAPAIQATSDYIVEQWTHLSAWVDKYWPAMQQAITLVMQGIEDVINAVVATIEEIWSVFHATILRILVAVWDQIKLTISTFIEIIKDIIQIGIDLVTGHWGDAWNSIKDLAATAIGYVVGTVENLLSIVGNVLGSLNGIALRALGNLGTVMGNALKSGLDDAISFINGLPGRILGILSGLPTLLVGVGMDMINGFIHGISSMAGAIIDAIKKTITDALPSFVKKVLGISSPSRVFAELGMNVGLGMAQGINGSKAHVDAAMRGMMGAVASGASGGSSSAGAVGGGGGYGGARGGTGGVYVASGGALVSVRVEVSGDVHDLQSIKDTLTDVAQNEMVTAVERILDRARAGT